MFVRTSYGWATTFLFAVSQYQNEISDTLQRAQTAYPPAEVRRSTRARRELAAVRRQADAVDRAYSRLRATL